MCFARYKRELLETMGAIPANLVLGAGRNGNEEGERKERDGEWADGKRADKRARGDRGPASLRHCSCL